MRYDYAAYNGQPFLAPDDLFASPQVVQFILMHGQSALDAMQQFDGQLKELVEQMLEAGLLERDRETGQLRLTPKMIQGIEHKALLEIFQDLRAGVRDGHLTQRTGRGDEPADGTQPYQFGDPTSQIDLVATLRNALRHAPAHGAPLPLHLESGDFELHQTEGRADTATCLLIDQSGSMMRFGRFYQAKRVTLGLASLIRRRFALDTLDLVGFHSLAQPVREDQLPLLMPQPVSIRDWEVRMRIPLTDAVADSSRIPLHFTNLQLGLREARRLLQRRGAANKQIFIITDGQPTAHVEPMADGSEMLYLLYPPSERTADLTLKEALRCRQAGIRIASFALVEDYWGMEWVGFIQQLTRLVHGMAYYCSSDDLTSTVVESYLTGRKRRQIIPG
ncbi:MAG: VWA domain-containing protein [Phycisphaeraceae bacterium]|nr:VWA domain-containing protein [Phycisphaeraceae bacterium]